MLCLEDYKKIYNGDMFAPTKIVSIDWALNNHIDIRNKGTVSPEENKGSGMGVRLNILEASVTENNAGFSDNAMAGVALAVKPPEKVFITQDEERRFKYALSQGWVRH